MLQVQLKQAHMNKAPPPVPKSYQKHKLERASLVEPDLERSMEITKSNSNTSLPNIAVDTTSTTTSTSNEPPVADLLSFSPPPTPPPRRRKKRGTGEDTPKGSTLDVPDKGGITISLEDHSSSDEVETTSSSSSSGDSPIRKPVAPPLPPRDNYVTMLQSKTMDLSLTDGPPPLPPRDEIMSPVLLCNSSSAPPLPPRDEPSVPAVPPRNDLIPSAPLRDKDKKGISPIFSRKTYTPPVPHKDFDMGPRRNSADVLCNSPSPDVSLMEVEIPWPQEDFGSTLARELLAQAQRSSFSEDIAKKLQTNPFMRPSRAVMDTITNDEPFSSSLPPPLIPSTSSTSSKITEDLATTAKSDPLDQLFDKSDLSKWVTTSSSNQQQEKNTNTTTSTTTPNGNVLS